MDKKQTDDVTLSRFADGVELDFFQHVSALAERSNKTGNLEKAARGKLPASSASRIRDAAAGQCAAKQKEYHKAFYEYACLLVVAAKKRMQPPKPARLMVVEREPVENYGSVVIGRT